MANNKVVIALGGNAIQTGNGATDIAQKQACYDTAKELANIIESGYQVVISHGNGPQVGNIVLQQEMSQTDKLPAMSLDTCGAMSEGMIGYWLQNALDQVFKEKEIRKQAATVITQVLVNPNDPAFNHPTKPIGSFYSQEEANAFEEFKGYVMIEDAGRGYRRVVPSPKPMDIVEKDIIKSLVDQQFIVIAGGGGGIPVIEHDNQLKGIEAVIDKDYASEKLAELIEADTLLILTAVEKVALDFGKHTQTNLDTLTINEALEYKEKGHFATGSMLPKVEAAMLFVESKPGRKAIITSLTHAFEALNGEAGTVITQ